MRFTRLFRRGGKLTGRRRFDLRGFATPGECRERVPTASAHFCLATSKIMEHYDLSFTKACELLEEGGYLFWAGVTPVYDLRGDALWRTKDEAEKAKKAESGDMGAEAEASRHTSLDEEETSFFTPDRELRCKFFTLVTRIEALNAKYPGGLEAYVSKYLCEYNRDITVQIAMAGPYLFEPYDDLHRQGLERGRDFVFFDGFNLGIEQTEDRVKMTVGVDWLEAYGLLDGATMVSLRLPAPTEDT